VEIGRDLIDHGNQLSFGRGISHLDHHKQKSRLVKKGGVYKRLNSGIYNGYTVNFLSSHTPRTPTSAKPIRHASWCLRFQPESS
jgi:hypothetical protein